MRNGGEHRKTRQDIPQREMSWGCRGKERRNEGTNVLRTYRELKRWRELTRTSLGTHWGTHKLRNA